MSGRYRSRPSPDLLTEWHMEKRYQYCTEKIETNFDWSTVSALRGMGGQLAVSAIRSFSSSQFVRFGRVFITK